MYDICIIQWYILYISGIVWIYPDTAVIETISETISENTKSLCSLRASAARGGEFFGNATSGCHHAGLMDTGGNSLVWYGLNYEHVGRP